MGFFASLAQQSTSNLARALLAIGLITALEMIWPRQRHSLWGRLRGVALWGVFIPVTALISLTFNQFWRALGVHPLISGGFGPWTFFVSILVFDFGLYWFHRAQHLWFWRFHAVHHSIRDLSAANSYHHVSEELIRSFVMAAPLGLLIDINTAGTPFMIGLYLMVNVYFLHSTTRLHLGPLRYVLQDNRFHRIHHSLEPQHFDRNFGGVFTLWDQLFGTAYFPQPDEWPEVGLADRAEPQTVASYLLAPFDLRGGEERRAPVT